MTTQPLQAPADLELLLARELVIRFLALGLSDPHREPWSAIRQPESQRLAVQAAEVLRGGAGPWAQEPLAPGEEPLELLDLEPALAALAAPGFDPREEYNRVFGLVPPKECPPYGTEYHRTREPFFRAQQLADVAGFYRAFGLEISSRCPDRPDHVSLELEFLALVLCKQRLAADRWGPRCEQAQVCREAWEKFFRDQVVWWLGAFARGLARKAEDGFYLHLARALGAWLGWERRRLGLPQPVLARPRGIEPPEAQDSCGTCTVEGCEELVPLETTAEVRKEPQA